MTKLVDQVVGRWQDSDGAIAELIYDGDTRDAITGRAPLKHLKRPMTKVAMYLRLNDGTTTPLPFVAEVYILPDRTGVVARFEPGEYVSREGRDHFPAPNNAAIFNADGSLRFQLKARYGDRIAAFHGGAMPKQWEGYMGVLIATHPDAPPEWVYAVDPSSPELISTGQWVRY